MPLQQGTHLGPYVIASPLGAGGMGEVYRAHDVRLGRDVAVKILPASVARDTDRLGRFEREARAIAALSHPNIVAVFDTGTATPRGGSDTTTPGAVTVPDVTYVVMELLTGETLASRLAQGPLAPRKATEIAGRIARGLSAAHDKGVVHRDVKPDNVFLTADGQVKLLDFGLARHAEGSATAAATVVTDAGTVLGTANYMSPEQVRSELAGPRADIFSLGAVLYEMLTGQRPFAAETAAETMTAILRADPPAFPETLAVPPALQRIITHCLEKRPEERFQSASDVAFALDALAGSTPHSVERVDSPAPRASRTTERLAWLALALSLAGVAGWLVATRPSPHDLRVPVLRATLPLPSGITLPSDGPHQWRLALSPDGSRVAFVGQTARGERSLWVRALDQDAATLIAGPRNPHRPFWSPDGRELGYSEEGRLLRVVPGSGRPVPIGAIDGRAAWRSADEFLVTSGFGAYHRLITPATGASREILTPTPRPGQVALYPSFLPDGQRLLFALYDAEEPRSGGFYVGGVDGSAMQLVTPANFEADKANVVVENGHLLSVRDGMLIARPFDTDVVTVTGEAFVVGGPVDAPANIGSAAFVAARDVVVYQPAPASTGSRLAWVGRDGVAMEQVGGDNDYGQLDLSPDGTRLLYSVTDQGARTRDIWMLDLRRGVTSRVTFDAADERGPIWAPDGERFVYRKNTDLVVRSVTGGEDTPFVVDDRMKDPLGWSPDGQTVLYRVSTPGRGGGSDVWRQTAGGTPEAFLDSSFNENNCQFSPDGRWVAFTSNESGETDVYVTAYPSGQGKWRVSSDGGAYPRWRAYGRELYYLSSSNQMMAVDVRGAGAGLEMSQPRVLFPISIVRTPGAQYVVTGDGQRFLVNMPIPDDKAPALHVVFNWAALAARQ